jgi:hypothetical protein
MHCDVCGRNLLRGEQPDVFLTGGERRTVCALCTGRATHEGWRREGDADPVSVRPPRGRRGRTWRGRMRQRGLDGAPAGPEDDLADPGELEADLHEHDELEEGGLEWDGESFVDPVAVAPPPPPARPPAPAAAPRAPRSVHAVPTNAEVKAARALEVFNAGEFPRRVSGVARSLGLPWVTARSLTPSGAMVTIVVAWELCWYRYEVDLADEGAGARQIEQGLELDELPEEDRAANAAADERGELRMLAG